MIANLDPRPYIPRGNQESMRSADPSPFGNRMYYRPRPEFDVDDNPVLAFIAAQEEPYRSDLLGSPDGLAFALYDVEATPEQIDHARTVLEAIAGEK